MRAVSCTEAHEVMSQHRPRELGDALHAAPRRGWRRGLGRVSCDNAMAEAFNSLFKAEFVRNKDPGAAWTSSRLRPWSTSIGTAGLPGEL